MWENEPYSVNLGPMGKLNFTLLFWTLWGNKLDSITLNPIGKLPSTLLTWTLWKNEPNPINLDPVGKMIEEINIVVLFLVFTQYYFK